MIARCCGCSKQREDAWWVGAANGLPSRSLRRLLPDGGRHFGVPGGAGRLRLFPLHEKPTGPALSRIFHLSRATAPPSPTGAGSWHGVDAGAMPMRFLAKAGLMPGPPGSNRCRKCGRRSDGLYPDLIPGRVRLARQAASSSSISLRDHAEPDLPEGGIARIRAGTAPAIPQLGFRAPRREPKRKKSITGPRSRPMHPDRPRITSSRDNRRRHRRRRKNGDMDEVRDI